MPWVACALALALTSANVVDSTDSARTMVKPIARRVEILSRERFILASVGNASKRAGQARILQAQDVVVVSHRASRNTYSVPVPTA